ncbi:hypothetical protein SAMN02927914_03118 [Mesorhizobium qingshengii]|uniref:Uncharacterized protein n=1 Tax=Mesorhizobium qingshengii TaxID=1165689 RepID=A0A1G5YDG8_9HYPH|nr:hypothetical protein SAMN02927914_03118 [Mesorhizobium qingshengii]
MTAWYSVINVTETMSVNRRSKAAANSWRAAPASLRIAATKLAVSRSSLMQAYWISPAILQEPRALTIWLGFGIPKSQPASICTPPYDRTATELVLLIITPLNVLDLHRRAGMPWWTRPNLGTTAQAMITKLTCRHETWLNGPSCRSPVCWVGGLLGCISRNCRRPMTTRFILLRKHRQKGRVGTAAADISKQRQRSGP